MYNIYIYICVIYIYIYIIFLKENTRGSVKPERNIEGKMIYRKFFYMIL